MVDQTPARPALAWRAGIAGARSLAPANLPRLAAQLRAVQRLAEQSHHIAIVPDQACHRIEWLYPHRVPVSQHIGSAAARVATPIPQVLDGWVRLFRVEAMEPG